MAQTCADILFIQKACARSDLDHAVIGIPDRFAGIIDQADQQLLNLASITHNGVLCIV